MHETQPPRSDIPPSLDQHPGIAQIGVKVIGLLPESVRRIPTLVFDGKTPIFSPGTVDHKPTNLPERIGEVAKAIGLSDEGERTPQSDWFHRLVDEAKHNKKIVYFEVAAVGTLLITAIVGYEGVIRHGRDIRELHDMITDHFKKKKQK